MAEIEEQGWSLNPGRYVGADVEDLDDEEFAEKLAAAHLEARELAARAGKLEAGVDHCSKGSAALRLALLCKTQ